MTSAERQGAGEACSRALAGDPAASAAIPDLLSELRERSRVDASGLWQRHHRPQAYGRAWPVDSALSRLLERDRCLLLGAREYLGVARNLAASWRALHMSSGDAPVATLLQVWRGAILGTLRPGIDLPTVSLPAWLDADDIHALVRSTTSALDDTEAWAEAWCTWLAAFSAVGPDTTAPAPLSSAQEPAPDSQDMAEAGQEGEVGTGSDGNDEAAAQDVDAIALSVDRLPDAIAEQNLGLGGEVHLQVAQRRAHYHVYTRRYDRVCRPVDLRDADTLVRLRERLDRYTDSHSRTLRRIARQLQALTRVDVPVQRATGRDGHELDTRHLHRLLSSPARPEIWRAPLRESRRDLAVTLLVDSSRSMLGRPMLLAAACVDSLASAFERLGARVEVLGFTTASLDGGAVLSDWRAAGQPADPGRLNALLHVVYKSASGNWRMQRRHLGLMLDADLPAQNIDGESIGWAASRLQRIPAARRLLLVITDGTPVDIATLGANGDDYLLQHLRAVITRLQRARHIELFAIGIGHDVSDVYRHAITIDDLRGLESRLPMLCRALLQRIG